MQQHPNVLETYLPEAKVSSKNNKICQEKVKDIKSTMKWMPTVDVEFYKTVLCKT